ncbi:hypothetical protein [Vibrio cholerae]
MICTVYRNENGHVVKITKPEDDILEQDIDGLTKSNEECELGDDGKLYVTSDLYRLVYRASDGLVLNIGDWVDSQENVMPEGTTSSIEKVKVRWDGGLEV